ncbi:sterol carrier protein 2-like [Brassica napus]|uniref:sterol carrier protein 2-like n=1 Tax=Brassica napus TaxID=3708 RepID=UPI00207AAF42|nr:sterol carrier protein 2-like [Brassica napus]
MKQHLSTDAGKELTEKIGLVYQINVAPKKLGFEEVTCIVDLKKKSPKSIFGSTTCSTIDRSVKRWSISLARGAMKIKGSLSAAQEVHP